ncbi:hypothetical protein K8T06_16540 [bacterium]|nr:hypothetical protein [bacterium]
MKIFRLMAWLLAPLGMITLAYLFLLPPEQTSPFSTDSIGVMILDPLPLEILDTHTTKYPMLSRIRQEGLTGNILPNNSTTMDMAILEILSGKNPRKLRVSPFDINTETYEPIMKSVDELEFISLRKIAIDAKQSVQIINVSSDGSVDCLQYPEGADNYTLTILRVRSESLSLKHSLSPEHYVTLVETVFRKIVETIDTWIVVCPMHDEPVTHLFQINNWLHERGYLNINDDGTFNFATTQAFYAGGNEPGLRINREMTYRKGSVPRIEYESVRKSLARDLRKIAKPVKQTNEETEEGVTPDDVMLFQKIFRGENSYSDRSEGHYPDLVWEQGDFSVGIIVDSSTTEHEYWLPAPFGTTWIRPGGWMMFHGTPFDHKLRDMDRLKRLIAADITPTVLYMLHLPVAKDMQGRVLRLVMSSLQHREMPTYIESYSMEDPLVEQVFTRND